MREINKATGSKWKRSRVVGNKWILETEKGFQFREFDLSPASESAQAAPEPTPAPTRSPIQQAIDEVKSTGSEVNIRIDQELTEQQMQRAMDMAAGAGVRIFFTRENILLLPALRSDEDTKLEPLPTPTTPPPQDNPVSAMLAEGAAKFGKVESVNPASNTAIIEVDGVRGTYQGDLKGENWKRIDDAPIEETHEFITANPDADVVAHGTVEVVSAAELEKMILTDISDNQARLRTDRNVNSEAQIAKIAANPRPKLLLSVDSPVTDGAPTVYKGQVLAGNGRSMGIVRAYQSGRADEYRKAVIARAKRDGIEIDENIKDPVLIRKVNRFTGGTAQQFADYSNTTGMLQMGAVELAKVDAEILGDFAVVETTESGDFTAATIRGAAAAFDADGRVKVTRETNGEPSRKQVSDRIRNAALAGIFNKAGKPVQDLLGVMESDEGGRIVGIIAAKAPRLVSLDPDLSLANEISDAVIELQSGLKAVKDGKFKNLQEWRDNRGAELIARTEISPRGLWLLDKMVEAQKTPTVLRGFFDTYLDQAEAEQSERNDSRASGDFFGGRTEQDVFSKMTGTEEFTLESATDEQLRQEAAAQRQRDLIAEGQARPLTGGVDLTADIFGEGDNPLFNERRDNLRLQSDVRNETINQSEPIEVADSEKTSENGQVYSIIPYAQPKAKPELSTEMKAAIIQKLRGLQPDQPPINVFFDSVKDEPVTLVDESTGVTVIDSAESVIEDEQGQQVTLRANETIAAQATKLLSDASKRSYAAFVGAGKWTANVASRFAKDFADFAMGEKFPSAISDIFSRFMVSLKPTVLAGLSFFSMTNFVGQEIVVSKAEEATVQGAEIKKFTAINPPKTKDGSYIGALIDIRSAPQPPKYEGESISVHDEVKNDAATVLDYVTSTGDNNGKPFVIVSKREGSIRAYDKDGNLVHKSTVLLGKSYGDVVLNRRRDLDQIRDNDKLKVTPSGRWETKTDTSKEYGRVVPLEEYEGGTRNAIHTVCTKFPHERRLDRLAGKLPNRISYGCINVYASTATKINDLMEDGGVVYVTPDEQTIEGYIEDLSEDDGTRYQEDFTAEDEAYFDAIDRGDMETAQRMVDEAAKAAGLVRSRHATGAPDFTVFSREAIPSYDPDTNIRGFHFSTEATPQSSYRYQNSKNNRVLDVFLDLRRTVTRREAQKMVRQGDETDGFPNGFDTVTFLEASGTPTTEQQAMYDRGEPVKLVNGFFVVKSSMMSPVDGKMYEGADLFHESDPEEFITGYSDLEDAFAMHNESHVVVRDPSQIKSADPVTYDANGNPIPLSQRFNPESDDIRYQKSSLRSGWVDRSGNFTALARGQTHGDAAAQIAGVTSLEGTQKLNSQGWARVVPSGETLYVDFGETQNILTPAQRKTLIQQAENAGASNIITDGYNGQRTVWEADTRFQRRRRRGQNAKGFAKLLEDGRVLLKGLLNSDFTTAVHEMAHAFEMTGYTGLTDEEVATLKNWAGDKGTDNRKMMERKASEKFARGWERYLADGKTPFAELQAIFDKMAKWMMDTYKTIAGSPIDVEISAEVRAIFDKIAARMVAPSTIVTPTGSTMTTEDGSPLPPAVDPATLETIETDEQLVGVARFYLENPLPPPREFNTPEGEPLPYALQRARADQEAALYGYDTAAWNQAAREFPELWERVMNESAGTGEAELDKLMMSSDPDRPLSDLEVARFTLEGLRRKAVLNKALTELQTAISSGNQKMVEEKQKLVDAASARYQTMLNQIARSRTAAGRALNAWKFALNEDFSQTTLYSRALTNYNSVRVANGKPAVNSLPLEEAKAVAQFAERMAKMQDEIDALKEAQRIGTDRANEQQAMIEVLKAERDAARAAKSTKVQDATRKVLVDKVRKAAKEARERLGLPPIDDNVRFQADPASDPTWRDRVIVLAEILIANPLMSTAQFADRVRNMFGEVYAAAAGRLRNDAEEYLRPMMEDLTGKERPTPEKVLESIDGSVELTNEMVYDLAKAHVFAGARDTQVITNVHNDLKDFYPDLTREDVAQLFTRYGETRDMNRSDEAKALRAAKSLELVQRQIDNLLTDGVMQRTGTKKDDPDIKLRELRKKRDDLAKDLGYVPVDPETQLSSAQTAAKKRMKNEMEELQKAIDTNTPIVRVKRGVTYTEDMEQMRANLEELRKSYESIFGQQRTPAERMKAVIKDLDRRIAKERELINKGILKEDESTNPVAVDSPEISARRELLKELRRQKEEAYDLANPGLRAAEVALKEAQRITKSWINKLAASQSDTPTWKSSSKPSAVEELIKSHIENPQPDFAQRLIDLGATAEQARILDSEIRSEVERRRIVADARNSPMEREARILRDLDRRIEAEKKLIDQGLIKPKKSVDYVLDSPEISARRERLKELKRQKYEAYDVLHPNERALDQAMKAAQKALERRQKIITEGLPAAKDKPARDANVTPTAELEALWEAADEMDVLITEMRKNRPLTPAQQLRQLDDAYNAAVRTREVLRKRIADGDLLPDSKAKPTVEERTRLVRAENEELRKQLTQMQRDAGVGAFAYDVREAKKVAALEKSIEELKRKRAQKDFSKRKTTEPVTSERIRTLELIKANERREYEQERAMAAFKTLGWGKKTIEIAMATWNARQILNLSGDFGVINRNYGKVQLFTLWNDVVTLLRKRGKARFSEDTIIGKVLSKGFEAFMDEKAEERLYAEMATDPRYAKMKDEGFTLVSPHESSHEITADGRVRINPMFIFNDKIIGALALLKGILHTGVSVALLPKTGGATWKEVLKGVAKTIGGAALAIGGARYAKRVERANRVMLNVGRWALLDAAGKIAGNVDPSMKPEYDKITTEALMTLTGQFAGRSGATKWLKSHSSALSIIFSFPQYVVTNMQSVLGIPLISAMYRADALNPKALAAALTKKKGPDTPDVNWKAVQAVATLQAQYYIGTAAKIWFWALVLGAWDDEDKESKGGVVVDSDHPQFGSIKIGNTFIDLNPRANKWVSDISRLLGDTIPDSDKLKEGKIVPDKMTPYIKSEMFKKMWYSQLNMNWKALADMSSGKLYQGGEIGKMGMLYTTDAVISEFASNLTARDITKMYQLHGEVKGTALSSLILLGANATVRETQDEYKKRKAEESRKYKPEYR